jgi:hypothetical protein
LRSTSVIGLSALLAFSALGCSGNKNKDNISWGGGQGSDNTLTVSRTGEFGLYAATDPKNPIMVFHVEQGEPLGFESDVAGKVIVVADGHRVQMPDGQYTWNRMEPNTGEKKETRK